MEIKKMSQIDPTSFEAGFWRNSELRLGTFSWVVSQLDFKWNLECFFLSLIGPEKCKEIGEIIFGGPRTEKKNYGKWLNKGRQKLRNFPEKM